MTKLKGTSTSTTSPENGFDECEKPEVTGTLGNTCLGAETRERESRVIKDLERVLGVSDVEKKTEYCNQYSI